MQSPHRALWEVHSSFVCCTTARCPAKIFLHSQFILLFFALQGEGEARGSEFGDVILIPPPHFSRWHLLYHVSGATRPDLFLRFGCSGVCPHFAVWMFFLGTQSCSLGRRRFPLPMRPTRALPGSQERGEKLGQPTPRQTWPLMGKRGWSSTYDHN